MVETAMSEQKVAAPTAARGAMSGIVVVSAYIAAQMVADITSLKLALIGPLSIDGGTFVYPLTFTLRDLVHKLLGKRAARTLIVTAAVINVLMAATFAFVAWLPPDPTWPLQAEFAAVLGPAWRIVLASIAAEVVSEWLDTEIYSWWVGRVAVRHRWARRQWLRVLSSNLVSLPVDILIFAWGAFGGVVPAADESGHQYQADRIGNDPHRSRYLGCDGILADLVELVPGLQNQHIAVEQKIAQQAYDICLEGIAHTRLEQVGPDAKALGGLSPQDRQEDRGHEPPCPRSSGEEAPRAPAGQSGRY